MRGDVENGRRPHLLEKCLRRVSARVDARIGQHLGERDGFGGSAGKRLNRGGPDWSAAEDGGVVLEASKDGFATTITGPLPRDGRSLASRNRTRSRPLVRYENV